MKHYQPVLILLIVILTLSFSTGCLSKDASSQRESIERPSVDVTRRALNPDHAPAQATVSSRSTSVTHPQITPGSTMPIPTGTIGTMVYGNVSEIVLAAQEISAAWDPDGLTCTAKSCTAGFVNSNGDSVQVRTTLYDSFDAAKAGYNVEKQAAVANRIITLDIPDESFGWTQKSRSEVVFRKNNAVVIVDYTTQGGPASVNMAKEFAEMYSQKL